MKSVLDAHCHTIASGHAYSTINECALEAANKKLELIAITDHAPEMAGTTSLMHFMNLHVISKKIAGVTVLNGVELNIMDETGRVDMTESTLKLLDVVIASLHPPCFPFSTPEIHTAALIGAIKNPFVKILGHPGDPRYLFDNEKVVLAAKEYGVAIEINNQSLTPGSFRSGGDNIIKELAMLCKKYGVYTVMNSDAHFHTLVGEIGYAEKLLDEIQMPENLILNSSVERFYNFIYDGKCGK